ncbi:MAG: plasmid mobilization protein [Steroidobacteraceae bacterium]
MQDSLAAAFVTRLLPMAADAFIQCRVTPEIKALVRALARRDQITESALVKQLLEVVLRSSAAAGLSRMEPERSSPRDMRLYVRLDPDDRLLLNERAAARGMPSATYVAVLVRTHLRNLAPLPKQELLALKSAVAELGAIGRNLNQIARAINQGQRVAGPGRDELRAMLQVGAALRDHVKALLAANAKTWDQGHAETAH